MSGRPANARLARIRREAGREGAGRMTARLFGTDGLRGRVNREPMTAETVLRLGMAAGSVLTRGDHRHSAVIGKDTRLSGYMFEAALMSGFTAVGMDVILLGPMPTPGVATLTRSLRADLGVMISASHNPYQDNGIKLFGPDGYKLSDAVEDRIGELIGDADTGGLAAPSGLGRARRLSDAEGRYIEFVKAVFPRELRLDGMKIALDCAHGAAYKVAPAVLWELGADVVTCGASPDGLNINRDCGSTHPEAMRRLVRDSGADIGISLDGDADRVVVADDAGTVLDGDQLLATIARSWRADGRLKGGGVVASVMSNRGLERFLDGLGLALVRAPVGDRYVVEHMRSSGCNLGGEQSGHIVLGDCSTTGDGLIAALQVLSIMVAAGRPLREVGRCFDPWPQVLRNVPAGAGRPLSEGTVASAVRDGERRLGEGGRVVVRPSGTEPVIRVMVEGEDPGVVEAVVGEIADAISGTADPARP